MIKVLIADDHKVVLEGLTSLLESKSDISVVGRALNGKQVIQQLKQQPVDVVVLDIEMPEMDGVETAKWISSKYPNIKILILTMYNEIGFIRKIVEAGANGYILKNKGSDELVHAIREVFKGKEHYGDEVTKTLINSMKSKDVSGEIKFTRREIDVLKLIAEEFTTPMISEKLHIAPTTVETHRRNLITKTGVASTNGLVRFAVENGYTI